MCEWRQNYLGLEEGARAGVEWKIVPPTEQNSFACNETRITELLSAIYKLQLIAVICEIAPTESEEDKQKDVI